MKALTKEEVDAYIKARDKQAKADSEWLQKTFDYIGRRCQAIEPGKVVLAEPRRMVILHKKVMGEYIQTCTIQQLNSVIEIQSFPQGTHEDGRYGPQGFFSGDDNELFERLLFELARIRD